MRKTIYCCDICGKEIKDYDSKKNSVSAHETNLCATYDICLNCLVDTINVFNKVEGSSHTEKFISFLLKRIDKGAE